MTDESRLGPKDGGRPLWNSLEIAKLIISMATPLALFALGLIVALQAQSREDAIRRESLEIARYGKMIEKRGELWDRLGPKLTVAHIEIMKSRAEVIDYNRVMNLIMSAHTDVWAFKYYFSDEFSETFEKYAEVSWQYADSLKRNRPIMPNYRSGNNPEGFREVTEAYDKFRVVLAKDLEIVRTPPQN